MCRVPMAGCSCLRLVATRFDSTRDSLLCCDCDWRLATAAGSTASPETQDKHARTGSTKFNRIYARSPRLWPACFWINMVMPLPCSRI